MSSPSHPHISTSAAKIHALPRFEIPLVEDSESENRNNPAPLPQVPEEMIAGSMMNDATKTSTSPIISEHSEIAADDHIERESPAKESTISERKKGNITRSNPNQSKRNNAHRKPKPTSTESAGERTISSMFAAMKRKLTPDKEADTSRNNQKMQRNEDSSES